MSNTTLASGCQLPTLLDPLLDPLPDIIPAGGISLLAGAPGVGKTALLAALARDFRDGRPIFGHQPTAIPAIGVVNADRGWARGAGCWFARVGFPDVRYYSMTDDPTFDPRILRRKFERTARLFEFVDRLQLPPGSLLFVDPIALFLGGNLLDYDTCAVACLEIRTLLRQRALTLIAAVHAGKIKAAKQERYLRLQDQILGSTAIFGFSDTQLYLASPEELKRSYYGFLWQSHLVPPETFALERDAHGLFQLWTGADRGNQAKVLALFPENGDEITFGALLELAEGVPLSRKTLQRTLEALVESEQVVKVRHGVYRRVVRH
jgi:hypothetical protein